jgi:hypothetical protein
MSQRVKTSARALVLTRSSQPENDHLRKEKYTYVLIINILLNKWRLELNVP